MLRLIEEIDSSTLITVGGRSYPHACIVENDESGQRWLLWHNTQTVQPAAWLRAHGAGVMGIVVPQGDVFWTVSTERFMEYRTESLGMYLVDDMRLSDTFPGTSLQIVGSALVVPPSSGFVHLHTHSDYSDWDGLQTVQEAVAAAVSDGQPALAISDHGNVAAHPDLARLAAKAGIKPIFAIETYLVPDRFGRDADVKYNHLILIAKTQAGLQNVWASSTEAYRDGLYDGHARLDWDTLDRYKDGVICSTGCLSGPVSKAILDGDEERARAVLSRLQHLYRDDLYVEIHTNALPEQHKVNVALVTMAKEYGIPMIGVVDSHFSTKEQGIDHKMWMACASRTVVADDVEVFGFNGESWLLSEAEARDALAYLGPDVVDECITNTVRVADSCTATIGGKSTAPTFSKASTEHPDPIARDVDRLIDLCMSTWEKKTTGKREEQDVYMARFEREMGLLIAKGFCGYFLMVADYCLSAKEGRVDGLASGKLTGNPILVGPGRGSGGGSLVAYLSGIIGVDPVDAELLFERFMTEGRESLPDFDVDFPASKKQDLLAYVRQTWGEEYVATVGSHLRLKSKGIINSLSSARSEDFPESAFMEFKAISKIITAAEAGTAGLGLTWEELWAQEGDLLEPYRLKYPEFFEQCGRLVNRLKTYGKHAAGVVISTDVPLTGTLPLRKTDDDGVTMMVTQFEKDALESLGLVKFDLLTIRTLDTIQMCVDLIREQRGTSIDVEEWRDEYLDPQVWAEVKEAHTLGIFQIETGPGTSLTRQMKPGSVAELADMITLVRPGPRRSGLTEKYLARRDGREKVDFPDPRMEQVLSKTYGCLLYQEDIMAACMVLAGYDGNEADEVRSILGKKKVEKIPAAGEKFIRESVARGMQHGDAAALWAQMAEFAKYSFNRAHAFAYAVIGYWCVSGATRLYDWDRQQYISVAKAFRDGVEHIACYDEQSGQTIRGRVKKVIRTTGSKNSDLKMGWVLRTKSNKRLECSEDHQILTADGYKPLREISIGDLIATERRTSVMLPERRSAIATGVKAHWETLSTEERTLRSPVIDSSLRADAASRGWASMEDAARRDRVQALIEASRGGTWAATKTGTAAECGHRYSSSNERYVCEWLNLHGISHESQVWVGTGFADFRIKGVYVEYDGVGRDEQYFEHKYGDEARVVIRSREDVDTDLAWTLEEELLRAGGFVTYEPVVSITKTKPRVMYDIVMEDEPHNFLADGIVVHNCAWLKFHYPVQFLTAVLSTLDEKERIPAFITEARRMGYAVLPPDINESRQDFTGSPLSVRYGFSALKGMGNAGNIVVQHQPFTSYDDFIERVVLNKDNPVNMGQVKVLARIGAFDSLVSNRAGLLEKIEKEASGEATKCQDKNDDVPMDWRPQNKVNPEKLGKPLPCTFDWSSEPLQLGRTGKPLKNQKQLPMLCSKACRNYVSVPSFDIDHVQPFTAKEIRDIEHEMLGVYLSSTPFDMLAPEDREECRINADTLEEGPDGIYFTAGLVVAIDPRKTKSSGEDYANVTIETEGGTFRTSAFDLWRTSTRDDIVMGRLALVEIKKKAPFYNLVTYLGVS